MGGPGRLLLDRVHPGFGGGPGAGGVSWSGIAGESEVFEFERDEVTVGVVGGQLEGEEDVCISGRE